MIQYSPVKEALDFSVPSWPNRSNDGQVVGSQELCMGRHSRQGSDIGTNDSPPCVAGTFDGFSACIGDGSRRQVNCYKSD